MGFCAPTPLAKGVAQLRFSNSCFSTALIPPTVTNNLYSQCRTARNWNRARKRSRNGIGSRSERRFPSPAASPNSLFQNILRASRLYARICEQNLSARVRNLHKTDILSRSIPKKNNGYPITVQLTAHPSGGWPSGRGKFGGELAEDWNGVGEKPHFSQRTREMGHPIICWRSDLAAQRVSLFCAGSALRTGWVRSLPSHRSGGFRFQSRRSGDWGNA